MVGAGRGGHQACRQVERDACQHRTIGEDIVARAAIERIAADAAVDPVVAAAAAERIVTGLAE